MATCEFCPNEIPDGAQSCPVCGAPCGQAGGGLPPVTLRVSSPRVGRGHAPTRPETQPAPQDAHETEAYHPPDRPRVATLCVLNDGSRDQGEMVWLREDRCVIGREEGDIIIPNDGAMSAKHAELVRHYENGQYRWTLRDLESSNGVFILVADSHLVHNQQILIGHSVFRFDLTPSLVTEPRVVRDVTKPLGVYDAEARAAQPPHLTEKMGGRRFELAGQENWIGRDSACDVVLGDNTVSPRHAKIFRGENGVWRIEDAQSMNGSWLRYDEMQLESGAEFQLGEQRFLFSVL